MEKPTIIKNGITTFYGPMFSGKSAILISVAEDFASVDAFQPSVHTRDGNFIRSRNGKQVKCKLVDTLDEATSSSADLIIIDEYQHFDPDIFKKALVELKLKHKTVVIAGLNVTCELKFKRNLELLQKYSDKMTELYAKCSLCGKPAKFAYKLTGEKAILRKKMFNTTREPRCEQCSLLL